VRECEEVIVIILKKFLGKWRSHQIPKVEMKLVMRLIVRPLIRVDF